MKFPDSLIVDGKERDEDKISNFSGVRMRLNFLIGDVICDVFRFALNLLATSIRTKARFLMQIRTLLFAKFQTENGVPLCWPRSIFAKFLHSNPTREPLKSVMSPLSKRECSV